MLGLGPATAGLPLGIPGRAAASAGITFNPRAGGGPLMRMLGTSTNISLCSRTATLPRLFGRHCLSTSTKTTVLHNLPKHPLILKERLQKAAVKWNRYLNVLSEMFAKQCNALAAQRIRRLTQIANLYSNLYDKHTVVRIVESMGRQLLHRGKTKPLSLMLGAVMFNWKENKISEQEMDRCGMEINSVKHENNRITLDTEIVNTWEKVMDRDNLQAWRKPIPDGSGLYEYKVIGSFTDIPARAFFNVQVDIEYRKQWDKLVIELDRIDRDEKSGTEMIRWVTHFPYPMRSREYIYTRRYKTYHDRNLMVFMAQASEHPKCPVTDEYVRVVAYRAKMVIKPHFTFDEKGFDYILTYYDDPQATIPTVAIKWMASTGVPNFVEKLHQAAKILHEGQNSEDETAIPM